MQIEEVDVTEEVGRPRGGLQHQQRRRKRREYKSRRDNAIADTLERRYREANAALLPLSYTRPLPKSANLVDVTVLPDQFQRCDDNAEQHVNICKYDETFDYIESVGLIKRQKALPDTLRQQNFDSIRDTVSSNDDYTDR